MIDLWSIVQIGDTLLSIKIDGMIKTILIAFLYSSAILPRNIEVEPNGGLNMIYSLLSLFIVSYSKGYSNLVGKGKHRIIHLTFFVLSCLFRRIKLEESGTNLALSLNISFS